MTYCIAEIHQDPSIYDSYRCQVTLGALELPDGVRGDAVFTRGDTSFEIPIPNSNRRRALQLVRKQLFARGWDDVRLVDDEIGRGIDLVVRNSQ